MEKVLTLRLPAPAARRLTARAKSLGKTPSALVREILAHELGETSSSLVERTRTFIGAVDDRRIPAGRDARVALDDWQPDRRRG